MARFAVKGSDDDYALIVGDEVTHAGIPREEAAMRLLVALNRETVSGIDGFGIH